MPNAFDITTASTSVPIDDTTRKGVASYTVKNICGRPLRGEAKLETDQPQILERGKEWVKIDGSEFRDFSADSAEQFTIQIEAPSQAPEGTYGFWLKVIGIENPDEMTDAGPAINFALKAPPPAAPWWKKIPLWVWIVAGVVLLLIIIGILVMAFVPLVPAAFTDTVSLDNSFPDPPNPSVDLGTNAVIALIKPFFFNLTKVGVRTDAVLPHQRVRIRSAFLRMTVEGGNIAPDAVRISASKATSAWNESPGSAAPNCDTQIVSTLPVGATQTIVEIDVTEAYKQIIADPENNFGICLFSPDPQYTFVMNSKDASNATVRPVIQVDYLRTVFEGE
jgi:hypothetical protein